MRFTSSYKVILAFLLIRGFSRTYLAFRRLRWIKSLPHWSCPWLLLVRTVKGDAEALLVPPVLQQVLVAYHVDSQCVLLVDLWSSHLDLSEFKHNR